MSKIWIEKMWSLSVGFLIRMWYYLEYVWKRWDFERFSLRFMLKFKYDWNIFIWWFFRMIKSFKNSVLFLGFFI